MTRTTPKLAPPLQPSSPHQLEDVWPLRMIKLATGPLIHHESSEESGFEHGTLRPRSRNLTTRSPRPFSLVIAELGRAMSWSSQGTKKKDKNYMSLFFSEGSAKTSKSFDPAKESKSWCEQTTTTKQSPVTTTSSPVLTNHCTSTTAATATTTSTEKSSAPAVCGGDCGNIMCSLSPVCIEDIFDDPKKPSSPTGPPSDEVSDDGSLRRRTKSEGCYSAAYRCKSSKKSSPSLDSSRELLSPPALDDSDEVDAAPNEENRTSSSSSTWSGRVRDLKREVKHRICRLRSPKSSNSSQVSLFMDSFFIISLCFGFFPPCDTRGNHY
ncbi:hypothetical protein AVEN_217598-1 [Araneus ventricosus]|uniref:Uncharacterized protein n=1 Tax=Araneus ventricosus TaxID=182803 RepID=A0A4Y2FFJ8_ARAVE|nr:hypothetical protein AVEN_217598-1 [Araneus ventricosus]